MLRTLLIEKRRKLSKAINDASTYVKNDMKRLKDSGVKNTITYQRGKQKAEEAKKQLGYEKNKAKYRLGLTESGKNERSRKKRDVEAKVNRAKYEASKAASYAKNKASGYASAAKSKASTVADKAQSAASSASTYVKNDIQRAMNSGIKNTVTYQRAQQQYRTNLQKAKDMRQNAINYASSVYTKGSEAYNNFINEVQNDYDTAVQKADEYFQNAKNRLGK